MIMRIAIFSDTFHPQVNGVVTSIINSSKALAKRGHHILIIVPTPKPRINLGKNIQIETISSVGLPTYKDYRIALPYTWGCMTKVHKFKPDIIHLHSPFSLGILGVICAKTLDIPTVGTYHTLFPEFLRYMPIPGLRGNTISKKMTWSYTNFVYNKCDLITTPSNTMRIELIKHGIKKPIKVLSNGIDLSRFHKANGRKTLKKFRITQRYILHYGRLSYEKNIEVILKAFRLVQRTHPDCLLVIAGKGPAISGLKKDAKRLGIRKSVKFTSFITEEDLIGLLSEAEMLVTASTVETQSLVVLESMACELPVVGVKSLAVPELVQSRKNGFLVEPHEYRNMSRSISSLLDSRDLKERMGACSLKTARTHCLEKSIDILEKLYKSKIRTHPKKKSLRNYLLEMLRR